MLTLSQVIASKANDILPGMVGLVAYVFPKEEKKNPMTQLPYFRQTVLLKDGKDTVFVSIDDPQDSPVGFLDDSHKGKKLYMRSVLNGKKQLSGIKRGSDLPSRQKPGETNYYVFVSNKAELSWSAPATGSELPPAEAAPVEPEGSFETATPVKPAAPVAAPVPKAAAPASSQDWSKVLGQVLVQYNDCLEDSIKMAERLSGEVGKVAGAAWSSEDVTRMANSIFEEATRRMR